MTNTKSAEKQTKINRRNRLQNNYYKTSVRTLIKLFFYHLENSKDEKKLKNLLSSIYRFIDKGTKKNVFHKNNAARKKSKLSASLKKCDLV